MTASAKMFVGPADDIALEGKRIALVEGGRLTLRECHVECDIRRGRTGLMVINGGHVTLHKCVMDWTGGAIVYRRLFRAGDSVVIMPTRVH